MGQAKLHDGHAIVGYNADDEAIDSEGRVIKGAPKRSKDTPPNQQPGALGAQTPEERIAVAVARAVKDPDAVLANAGAQPAQTAEVTRTPDAPGEQPAATATASSKATRKK